MLAPLSKSVAAVRRLRRRFGLLPGLRVGWDFRPEVTARRGTVYRVRTPGLPHPVWLRAGTSDAATWTQIFVTDGLGFDLPAEPRLIVDAGANVGLASAYLAARFPRARVVALELDADNFAALRRNVAPYPNVTPLHRGLWSGPARLAVANPGADAAALRGAEARDEAGVEAVGVADLLREFGSPIDLLKVDIEGGEVEVFGAPDVSWLGQVRTLAVELHDRFRPGCRAALDRGVAGRGFTESRRSEYVVLKAAR